MNQSGGSFAGTGAFYEEFQQNMQSGLNERFKMNAFCGKNILSAVAAFAYAKHYFMQTRRTCTKSVKPFIAFWIPSCRSVVMPSLMD